MIFEVVEDGVIPEHAARCLDEDPNMLIECMTAIGWVELDKAEFRNGNMYRIQYR
jgi:hypothetical protein